MTTNITLPTCHGCAGRGWVDTQKGAQICPICYGSGTVNTWPRYPVVTFELQSNRPKPRWETNYAECTHPNSMACCATGH